MVFCLPKIVIHSCHEAKGKINENLPGVIGDRMLSQRVSKTAEIAIVPIAVAMVLYHLMATQHIFMPYELHKNTHLAFALVLLFLSLIRTNPKRWPLFLGLTLCSIGATAYVFIFYDGMVLRLGFPSIPDIIVGIILIIVVLEATRRAFGLVLPIFTLIFVAYTFLGNYIPGYLHVAYFGAENILVKMALDFRGLYGMILSISVNYIFLFIVFGALVKATGAVKFFEQVGRLAGRRFRGGTALSSIASSALFGSITGTASANVLLTGSFTIPVMKQAGYTSEQAGAIEASASTVGQVMPPVMGAAAFLMAYFTGVPYVSIIGFALLPALLTYGCMGLYTQLQAMKTGISPPAQEVNYKEMLRFSHLFFIPLFLLIALLVMGYTPMYAIFWAILVLVAMSLIRRETRLSWREWAGALVDGAILGSRIAVMCAIIGMVVATVIMTGLGVKFPGAIEATSGGNIVIALVLTMIISMILGLGMPTSASYTLVAFMVAPFLIRSGIDIIQAHFFVFYYAVFALVTPPVAPAAITASALAGGKFIRTGIEASKVAVAGFLLPFLIIWCPVLILKPESLLIGGVDLIVIIVILICLQVLLVGHYFTGCSWQDRLLTAISAVLLLIYCYSGNYLFLVGLATFLVLSIAQFHKRSRLAESKWKA